VSTVVGPVPEGRDPEEYDRLRRKVLWLMPSGLYVLGTRAGERRNLMTVSWVTQVALEPKLVGVGVERRALTHELLEEGRIFALSFLPRNERALVRKFVKPVADVEVDDRTGTGTMNGVAVRALTTGAPVLELAAASLDCELRQALDLGSHSWFVGEVVDCGSAAPPDGAASNARGAPVEATAGGTQVDESEAGDRPDSPDVLRMEDTRMSYGG
jgi:flavin reductase (DIM6/NTAB) family NADH-FMN oxidoreductase RutF